MNRIVVIFTLFALLIVFGCWNTKDTEIEPKREVSPQARETRVVPLPTAQRLRLIPEDTPDASEAGLTEVTSRDEITEQGGNTEKKDSESVRNTSASMSPATGGFGNLGLAWTVPEGWKEDRTKPMRLVTFNDGNNRKWECYISVLMSQAGGVEANLRRWAIQMGHKDWDSQQVDTLLEITILGKPCKFLDITGTYIDMQGVTYENYRLLGVVCPLEDRTLFIKMTGPADEVAQQKEKFVQLCNSLTLKE